MVIELMGRTAGWLTLFSGIAGGGDVILIPEIPFDIERVCECVITRSKKGKRYSIICVAEGAKEKGKDIVVQKGIDKRTGMERLGGIGNYISSEIESRAGIDARLTSLGHVQRGGSPTPFDRVLATRYGCRALELACDNVFDITVCLKGDSIEYFPLEKVADNPRTVPQNSEFVKIAKSVGTIFGD